MLFFFDRLSYTVYSMWFVMTTLIYCTLTFYCNFCKNVVVFGRFQTFYFGAFCDYVICLTFYDSVFSSRLDLRTGLVCLDNQWVSQANVSQRRGRAGRVQPGESYHMFSEQKFNSLEQFPIPEISRIPLTRSVLDVKVESVI